MLLVNIILIAMLWTFIRRIFWKQPPDTVLQCGIWGFNGVWGRKPDFKKLLILGLYNRTRGVDSCGYYYNGNIVKGVDKEADFKDFIITNKFAPGVLDYMTVMCHARKSTYGSHSLGNAHPHLINNYVQTHNGTLKNTWDLCNKHGIVHTNIHVDSIGLAAIIEKDGFSVLNEYTGHAALSMVFMDDPKSLYLFHGASREKEDGTLFEERPLFYLKTAEGLYYSSLEESLKVINTSKNVVTILPHNEVYRIVNGDIESSVFHVDRENVNIPKVYTYTPGKIVNLNNRSESNTYNWKADELRKKAWETTDYEKRKNGRGLSLGAPFTETESEMLDKYGKRSRILKETLPPSGAENDVYYRYGRHHTSRIEYKNNLLDPIEYLLHGIYIIDRKSNILDTEDKATDSLSDTYYFVRGVMMKDQDGYNKTLAAISGGVPKEGMAKVLSKYSRYPVTSYFDEADGMSNALSNLWYLEGEKYDGKFDAKFTFRKYVIKGGYFSTIQSPIGEVGPTFEDEMEERTAVLDIGMTGEVDDDDSDDAENGSEGIDSEEKKLIDSLKAWSKRQITRDNITLIPEAFFLIIEEYIHLSSNVELTDTEYFNMVVYYLEQMIETGKTLLESDFIHLDTSKGAGLSFDDMVELTTQECDIDTLLDENRFKVWPFKSIAGDGKDHIEDIEFEELTPKFNNLLDPSDSIIESIEDDESLHDSSFDKNEDQNQKALFRENLLLIRRQVNALQEAAVKLQEENAGSEEAQTLAFEVFNSNSKLSDIINKPF